MYLLRAWAKLGLPNAELEVIGLVEPQFRSLVLHEIQRAAGTARLCGPSTEPEKVLRGASALVMPSVQDGFGLVVLEAMASGLPVIVSEHVGAKDCVREGIDGYIVPARDVDAIADRLQYLHVDESRRRMMGRNAREQAMRFPWGGYRERLLTKIEGLMGTDGAGSMVEESLPVAGSYLDREQTTMLASENVRPQRVEEKCE